MNKREAKAWVKSHSDDDNLEEAELVAAFTALYGRRPDQDDYDIGIWSLCCAEVQS